MEFQTADPDTQIEVDLMILDYLLCVTIDLVLCSGKAKTEGQQTRDWDVSWNLNTIDTIRAALLHAHLFSQDIHIKIQILEFAQIFSDDHRLLEQSRAPATTELPQEIQRTTNRVEYPVTEARRRSSFLRRPPRDDEPYISNGWPLVLNRSYDLLERFITLCHASKNRLPEGHADIATKLIMQAALSECRTIGNRSRDGYRECVHRVIERLRKTSNSGISQANTEYLSYIRLPIDPPPDGTREAPQRISHINGMAPAVHVFLTNLMKTLNPPILLQLERGKLGGLSREETQQLKDKVGL
ncbi:hypothetical protein BO94DRAFT_504594 [Aspergillus sclerotioniger CBS 115572]|uniref:Uncharacterized protein n=1 Tax=Aspergillus sclerotioniger CBS 115572 TaxID=1450535 RepID=A0A317UW93_9EURO|nr:hypothetical protein BO94DRAFT_504594 [Aspergillus sclerotioniger CBS 115572]PWY65945.1 hypothetical protein BO94DRAFT_504594 [Aspergillus sclerotioniger CBS 115572]